MKISEQPTNHILVRASTNSNWSDCDYAVVTCGEGWAEVIGKRLEAAQAHYDDKNFICVSYYDDNASFHIADERMDNVLSDDKPWAFVELTEGEKNDFPVPASSLDCHALDILPNGAGRYIANGEETGEEYYTEELPLPEIVNKIKSSTVMSAETSA